MKSSDVPVTKADASVKSAARVLSIFEYFEKVKAPRTLSEISEDLQYPVSSTLALLRSVQAMGYLNYDHENKTYCPSARIALLGQWTHDRLFQGGAILQMMEHLATLTQETVSLGLLNGLQSQHAHIIQTSQSLSYNPTVGTLRPLLRSAVGRAILSRQPRARVLRIVDRINALKFDEGRSFHPEEVLADLEQVRRDGYAYSANVFTQGAAIVSVPLPLTGDVPMAVSISGPTTRIDEQAVPRLYKQIRKVIRQFLPDADRHTEAA